MFFLDILIIKENEVINMTIFKKNFPNILTFSRIIITPLIIYLGIVKQYIPLFITTLFIAFTDYLDGYLARKWQVESLFGAKLDTIADKVLALSLLIVLVFQNKIFLFIFILESFISLLNIYYFYKTKIVESLLVGKIKTWIIFIAILLGLLKIFVPKINLSLTIFIILTIILQIICLIKYTFNYFKNKNLKKNTKKDEEYLKIVQEILDSPEFLKRKEFMHHYNESVYDHVLKVSYKCYQIGKKHNLDYKALSIAGLLHDFYPNPWQVKKPPTPFFQKHGFVHAHEARINAEKFFPKLMNEKIASMIETHMFPFNITPPKTKEGWLLTLVDKSESLDFLMHPLLFTGIKKNFSKR